MAKLLVVAVCLAAIVAVAVGQIETEQQRLRDAECRQEVQQSPLDACRQVVHRQLIASRTGYGAPFQWGTGMRMQCCQQLLDVSRECRCSAIRRMVRGYEQSMPPLEAEGGGYYGERTGRPQQEGYYGCGQRYPTGQRQQQQGQGYYGGGEAAQQYPQGGEGCRCGQRRAGAGEQTARVTLGKVRQYAARLPMMCSIRMEPQECSVFSSGQYY